MKVLSASFAIFALAGLLIGQTSQPAVITKAATPEAVSNVPTELDDHEKVLLWNELGDLNELLMQQRALEDKMKAGGAAFEAHINELRKLHNGVGCEMDYKVMRFHNCKPPVKK